MIEQLQKRFKQLVSESLQSMNDLNAGTWKPTLNDWHKIYDNALFVFSESVIELQDAYENYINVLGDEISDLHGFALIHGWESENVERGIEARKRIEQVLLSIIGDASQSEAGANG